jgi:hypothetical protein
MRTCHRCGATKAPEEFYRNPPTKCRECQQADVRTNRELRRDYYARYDKTRDRLPHRVAKRLRRQRSPDGRIDKMINNLRSRTSGRAASVQGT